MRRIFCEQETEGARGGKSANMNGRVPTGDVQELAGVYLAF